MNFFALSTRLCRGAAARFLVSTTPSRRRLAPTTEEVAANALVLQLEKSSDVVAHVQAVLRDSRWSPRSTVWSRTLSMLCKRGRLEIVRLLRLSARCRSREQYAYLLRTGIDVVAAAASESASARRWHLQPGRLVAGQRRSRERGKRLDQRHDERRRCAKRCHIQLAG